jgi:hypothetical protein
MRKIYLAAAMLLAAWGCAQSANENTPVSSGATQDWERINPEPVRINGRLYEPTCSDAPGANKEFAFWFKQGRSDALMVYFDGGGACWNDETCAVPRLAGGRNGAGLYKGELIPGDDPTRMNGLFDLSNPRNPVRDWSILFVPYCTADVHSGSNTALYRNLDTGEPYTIQHRGWDNFQVILHWMRDHTSKPQRLLVTGSSAGAYGAATHFSALRKMYPSGRAVFLGDGGQGVTTAEFSQTRNTNWNYTLPASVFGRNPHLTPDAAVVARLAAKFPRDRFTQYTTTYDATQRAFYGQMGSERSCEAWTNSMVRELKERQNSPNFRSYLARGETHTILRSPLFYAEQSGGEPFAEWLATVLSEGQTENRSCSDCLSAPAQCSF